MIWPLVLTLEDNTPLLPKQFNRRFAASLYPPMAELIHASTKRLTGVSLFSCTAVFFTVFCAVLFCAPPNCFGDPEFIFVDDIAFDDMQPNEIFSNNSDAQAVDEGSFSPDASWDGTVSETGFESGDLDQVYNSLTFRRWTKKNQATMDKNWVWQYKRPKTEPHSSIAASYTIEDVYGNDGRLSHETDPASWIEATEINAVILDQSNRRFWRFRGRVRIEFDISTARRSGTYRGTLRTTLTYL